MLFLAEVYWDLEWRLQQQGFHYTYDKRLLDRLYGSSSVHVRGHLHAEPAYSERLARFLENHDEPRSATALASRLPAAAALFATLPGMRFYFDGQLHGRRTRSPVQLGRWAEEPVDPRLATIYERLLRTTALQLFHVGEWKLIEVSSAGDDSCVDLIAYRWRLDDQVALIVTNLGGDVATGHLPVSADLPRADAYDFVDELNEVSYHRTRKSLDLGGLYVRLDPAQAHVFIVHPHN
jgi:glycosidase